MNGEVNGTMETLMDTSSSEVPDNVLSQKKVDLEGCETSTDPLDCKPIEDSNHIHSEESDGCETAEVAEHLENEHGNSSDNDIQSFQESTNVPENVNSKNRFTENHCNNSNHSDAESMSSSQAKSETTDQQIMHNSDDKCMDEESEKEFEKDISHVQRTNNEVSYRVTSMIIGCKCMCFNRPIF